MKRSEKGYWHLICLSYERPILGDHPKAHISEKFGFQAIRWISPENLINQIIQQKLFSFLECSGKAMSQNFMKSAGFHERPTIARNGKAYVFIIKECVMKKISVFEMKKDSSMVISSVAGLKYFINFLTFLHIPLSLLQLTDTIGIASVSVGCCYSGVHIFMDKRFYYPFQTRKVTVLSFTVKSAIYTVPCKSLVYTAVNRRFTGQSWDEV